MDLVVPKSSRVLFLDDCPNRTAAFKSLVPFATCVDTANKCIACLEEDFDFIFLDHDLGGEIYVDSKESDCGMEVVRWLCRQERHKDARIIIHSMNRPAAERMKASLCDAGFNANTICFFVVMETIETT